MAVCCVPLNVGCGISSITSHAMQVSQDLGHSVLGGRGARAFGNLWNTGVYVLYFRTLAALQVS